MPITITITDPTPEQIAALFGDGAPTESFAQRVMDDAVAPKPARKPRTIGGSTPSPTPTPTPTPAPEDAELAAEIARDIAEAPPEPTAATQVVDAGTGKPLTPVSIEELRANATRLAQKDTPALAALLKQFGATKLSEVGEDQRAAFAAEVVKALG